MLRTMTSQQVLQFAGRGRCVEGQSAVRLLAGARRHSCTVRRTLVTFNAVEIQAAPLFTNNNLKQPKSGKHFLHIDDWSKDELWETLQTAQKLKAYLKTGDQSYKPFAGKTLAMIFTKPSMRTRISFETVLIDILCVFPV